MRILAAAVDRTFAAVEARWNRFVAGGAMGSLLVAVFLGVLVAVELNRAGLLPRAMGSLVGTNHFAAVGTAFMLLLFVEILALVFGLVKSVADSVGKQFELFSLILLRKAFLEFGKSGEPIAWETASSGAMVALADILGALLIFVVIGFYYRLQRHKPIVASETEQENFILGKKMVALALLAGFVVLGILDGWYLLSGVPTYDFFHAFYTLLIFSDVLIVLISMIYTTDYQVVFRNSGFAAATVILRLALVSPPVISGALGLGAALLVLGLTAAYNAFTPHTAEPSRG